VARPTRLDIEGGWYHVLNRGIEKRTIFRGVSGYEHFLVLLSKLPQRFGLSVHGYVLMPNHYHLQVETPKANLSRAIQWLNVSYSIWFNKKYQRVGPLFQGRFKAVLHDWPTHGLTINRYIHLNPVRVYRLGGHEGRGADPEPQAGSQSGLDRVEALRSYQWSSYAYYSGKAKAPEWLTTEKVLELMSDRKGAGAKMAAYRRELEQAAAVEKLANDWKDELKATLLLGSSEFVEKMKKLLEGDHREQTGIREAKEGNLSWEAITAAVSEVWGQDWELLRAGYGNGALAAALYFGRNYSDRSLHELGQLAGGMQYPAVTMAIRRFSDRLPSDKALAKKVKRLARVLHVKT
jgi:putative transposase